MATRRVAVSGGAVLRVTTTGSGPPLALCHGGPGLWDYLAPLAGLIGDHMRVHRYDQRGCGLSTGEGPFTVDRFVADLEALRRALGHRAWWVGGHSWGAELALRYALAFPARVLGVLYISGTGIGNDFRAAYQDEMRRRLGTDVARWARLRDQAVRSAAEEREFCLLQWRPDFAPTAGARRLAEALWDDRFRVNRRCNAELNADRARDEADLSRRSGEIVRPVLILHGDQDPRPVWATDSLVRALPRVRRVVIAGAGHLPWAERPTAVGGAIADFLRHPPGDRPHPIPGTGTDTPADRAGRPHQAPH